MLVLKMTPLLALSFPSSSTNDMGCISLDSFASLSGDNFTASYLSISASRSAYKRALYNIIVHLCGTKNILISKMLKARFYCSTQKG